MDESIYENGNRAAWLQMLQICLSRLGVDDPEREKAAWVSEREQAIAALRSVCEEHGDNDWDERLHLADVIGKHLHRHLSSPA